MEQGNVNILIWTQLDANIIIKYIIYQLFINYLSIITCFATLLIIFS
jgi:hypothetical protein